MQTRVTAVGSSSESRLLPGGQRGAGCRRSRAMIRGRETGMKASIKLLQYVFGLMISGAGFATMIVILHHALR